MEVHIKGKLPMPHSSNETCMGQERPVVAFRLLWWLEKGCLDLFISRTRYLCTALHCATDMSPVLNTDCCHYPCSL